MSTPCFRSIGVKDVSCGEDVTIVEPSNVYGCTLGNNVFIGPFVEIQKDVFIGNNTRVQSHCFICELVSIGNNCTIALGVMFINDRYGTALLKGIKVCGLLQPFVITYQLAVIQLFYLWYL